MLISIFSSPHSRLRLSTADWLALIVCLLVGVLSQKLQATTLTETGMPYGQLVALELTTGREVHGELVASADDNFVTLQKSEQSITLLSQFPRSKVLSWRLLQESTETGHSDPKNPLNELKDRLSQEELAEERQTIAEVLPTPQADLTINQKVSRLTPRVASLRIEAAVANWDADAAVDGIEVFVQPVDQWGNCVPLRGQIDFQLLGQRSPWDRTETIFSSRSNSPRFGVLEDWSRVVRSKEVSQEGILYRLEFRNFHPDRDLDVSVESILHARLGVPGQGLFEASSNSLLLRPISFLRDDLQLQTESRSFPQERLRR